MKKMMMVGGLSAHKLRLKVAVSSFFRHKTEKFTFDHTNTTMFMFAPLDIRYLAMV